MIVLVAVVLFELFFATKSDNFDDDNEEPPLGVERNLLNSASKRREFRAKSDQLEKERAETNKLIAKYEKEKARKYRNKLKKMSPEEQEKRKDLHAFQEERVKKYKEGPIPMTKEEIKDCTGYYPDMPVLLSVKGRIYDVTNSTSFRDGGSYYFFAGKDCSYAFAVGSFLHENLEKRDDLEGLVQENFDKLNNWVKYFEEKENYYYVGPLIDYKYATSKNTNKNSFFKESVPTKQPWEEL